MNVLRAAAIVAKKDLLIESHTKEIVTSTGLFAVLVVVLASLSFYVDGERAQQMAPGVLWIAIAFSGVLAMGRTWARERDNQALRGLLMAPIPRASIYLGKLVGSLTFALVIELIITPIVAILFQVDLTPVLLPLSAIILLGTLGFVAVGTLFSAMSVGGGARDLMLSVVIFPLITPALLCGVVATRELIGGAGEADTMGWIRIMLAFDLTFLVAGYLLFEPLTTE